MPLLDDYQQWGEDEEEKIIDPAEGRKKRADLERQIVIQGSDLKKLIREIEELEIQRRRFKKEEERIRVNRDELDKKLKKMQNDKLFLEEGISSIKKKLKILQ